MSGKDELDLINGLKANDPFYLQLLIHKYTGLFMKIAMSNGLDREGGLGVTSDSLCRIVQKIDQFDITRGSRFTAWVARIATNITKDKLKKIKNQPVLQSSDERAERGIQDVEALWQEQDQSDSEAGQLSQDILRQAMDRLSEADQDILRCCACGYQHKEIAVLMNKTPGAVKVAHHRAKARLKQSYIDILESLEDKSKAAGVKDFLGIGAVNEETQN